MQRLGRDGSNPVASLFLDYLSLGLCDELARNAARRLNAQQDGGEGRTRTFEAIRRLIYSQLPLPLGTLPRLNSIANPPAEMAADKAMDDVKTADPMTGCPVGAFMGEAPRQSQPSRTAKTASERLKLPLSGTRDTSLAHERSRPKTAVPARRRQSLRKGPRIRPPAGLARPRREPGRPGDSLWLAHGGGGAGQSAAPDPQTAADRERRAAARGGKHRHPRDAGNRAAEPDRPAARSRRRASGAAGGGRSPALAGHRHAAAGRHRAGARPDHRSAQCRRDHALGGGVRGQGHRHHRAPQPGGDRRAGEIRVRRAGTGAAGHRAKSRARAHRNERPGLS